jgi:hypothetical protein
MRTHGRTVHVLFHPEKSAVYALSERVRPSDSRASETAKRLTFAGLRPLSTIVLSGLNADARFLIRNLPLPDSVRLGRSESAPHNELRKTISFRLSEPDRARKPEAAFDA